MKQHSRPLLRYQHASAFYVGVRRMSQVRPAVRPAVQLKSNTFAVWALALRPKAFLFNVIQRLPDKL